MNKVANGMLRPGDCFLFLAAAEPSSLAQQVTHLLNQGSHDAEAIYAHNKTVNPVFKCRMVVSGQDAEETFACLKQAKALLERGIQRTGRIAKGIFFCHSDEINKGKLAFVFPGQGSQFPGMSSELIKRYPEIDKWLKYLDEGLEPVIGEKPSSYFANGKYCTQNHPRLFDLDIGACIVTAYSLAYFDLITKLGIRADMMLGHSTGETTALIASNSIQDAMQESTFRDLVGKFTDTYRTISKTSISPEGTILSVGGISSEVIQSCFNPPLKNVFIALDNCPNQKIVFCSDQDADLLSERLNKAGAVVGDVPFRYAYHTPLFQSISQSLETYYTQFKFGAGSPAVYSCITNSYFPTDEIKARKQAQDLLHKPVHFQASIEDLYQKENVRTFLEIGPRNNISAFMQDTLRGRNAAVISSGHSSMHEVDAFLQMIAQLFVTGHINDIPALYHHAESEHLNTPLKQSIELSNFKSERNLDQATHAAVLKIHFNLMQTFLEQQNRMMNLLTHAPANLYSPTAPKSTKHFPLIGHVMEQNERNAVCKRVVTLQNEPYLLDHAFGGLPSLHQKDISALPVIPFTFSMETVAEAALTLFGQGWAIKRIYDVRAIHWFMLFSDALDIEIQAQKIDTTNTLCRIYNVSNQQRRLSFVGKVELTQTKVSKPKQENFKPSPPVQTLYNLDNFYIGDKPDALPSPPGEFHGPLFQAVKDIRSIGKNGIIGELVVQPRHQLFSQSTKPDFVIDPIMIDASMHLIAFWIHSKYAVNLAILPFQISSYAYFDVPQPVDSKIIASLRITFEQTDGSPVPENAAYRFFNQQGELSAEHLLSQTYPGSNYPKNAISHHLWPETLAIRADVDFSNEQGDLIATMGSLLVSHFSVPDRFENFTNYPSYSVLSDVQHGKSTFNAFDIDFLLSSGKVWLYKLAYLVLTENERAAWVSNNSETASIDFLYKVIVIKDLVRMHLLQAMKLRLAPIDLTCEPFKADTDQLWRCSNILEDNAQEYIIQVQKHHGQYIAKFLAD